MFRREPYRAMAQVLDALDAESLERSSFLFAGGTRIALEHDEFRLSRDLDFICSDGAGYAALRADVRDRGYDALFRAPRRATLGLPREVRADQYGLRFPVVVEGATIRVELIREARIVLGAADHASWTHVPLLSIPDLFAEKLLANSDRGLDPDELARDLVDLAVLRRAHGPIPKAVWAAVEAAYRAGPRKDLRKVAERFLADKQHRERCFAGLGIDEDSERVVEGVHELVRDLDAAVP